MKSTKGSKMRIYTKVLILDRKKDYPDRCSFDDDEHYDWLPIMELYAMYSPLYLIQVPKGIMGELDFRIAERIKTKKKDTIQWFIYIDPNSQDEYAMPKFFGAADSIKDAVETLESSTLCRNPKSLPLN